MNRYERSSIIKTENNVPYYKGKFYPNIPLSETDIYVITTSGDRLDSLANIYYNDPTLWWIISVANNNITRGLLFPQPGTQLRIPLNISDILAQFDEFNQTR
jgi:hypothetical protein